MGDENIEELPHRVRRHGLVWVLGLKIYKK